MEGRIKERGGRKGNRTKGDGRKGACPSGILSVCAKMHSIGLSEWRA